MMPTQKPKRRSSSKAVDSRLRAAEILVAVVMNGQSLASRRKDNNLSQETALTKQLCYGSLRWFFQLDYIAKQLLRKPLPAAQSQVYMLILLGLYQLIHLRIADHAAINQTVNAGKKLGKPWIAKLLNGVLRQFQRQQSQQLAGCDKHETARYAHPQWFISAVQVAWVDDWQSLLRANNQQPPLSLRVNHRKISRDDYWLKLQQQQIVAYQGAGSESALTLQQPCAITAIPEFESGEVSVQDSNAQLAAPLLAVENHHAILDACCAPGGKTGHLLELAPEARVVAIDCDGERLQRVKDNLDRLGFSAQLLCLDIEHDLLDKKIGEFDRILLDAPCSATGVIRRHPDIKLLRRPEDIATLARTQYRILERLWSLLKLGGQLLYAVCSVLPAEGEAVIDKFLQSQPQATAVKLNIYQAKQLQHGYQLLPQDSLPLPDQGDGFYYCLLRRESSGVNL